MVRTETGNDPERGRIGAVILRSAFLAIAATAAIWTVGAAIAADDPLLRRLVGEWEGAGTFRWDAASAPERLYCRISAALTTDGSLRQTGRCALATDSAALTIEISPGSAGRYSGVATGSMGLGIILRKSGSFTGTGRGNQLVLTAPPDGQEGPVVTTIDLTNRGFRTRTQRVDNATGTRYVAAELTFGPSS
jgi:hypothetical protein